MMSDCYRAMNKSFNPTPTDVASFARVLDSIFEIIIHPLIGNGSGRIYSEDVEKLCTKYFGGAQRPAQPNLATSSLVSQQITTT